MSEHILQQSLFGEDLTGKGGSLAHEVRNAPMFLRNQFKPHGKYGFPLIRASDVKLDDVGLIACTNTIADDCEYFDFGVHFFVDDCEFDDLYDNPEKTLAIYSQYRFCCTPDYSVYAEMPIWRQIESVAKNRWCGAFWQTRGIKVVPTVSWDRYSSYDFCFDGIEQGAVVAVATYACRSERTVFMRGYDEMLERLSPRTVICYGRPFPMMRGDVVEVEVSHPRKFHRAFSRHRTTRKHRRT